MTIIIVVWPVWYNMPNQVRSGQQVKLVSRSGLLSDKNNMYFVSRSDCPGIRKLGPVNWT